MSSQIQVSTSTCSFPGHSFFSLFVRLSAVQVVPNPGRMRNGNKCVVQVRIWALGMRPRPATRPTKHHLAASLPHACICFLLIYYSFLLIAASYFAWGAACEPAGQDGCRRDNVQPHRGPEGKAAQAGETAL